MAKGVKAALKFQKDHKTLSPRKAIMAHCAECMGLFEDGPMDCKSKCCSLYPYMQYNPNRVKGSKPGLKGKVPVGFRKDGESVSRLAGNEEEIDETEED